MKNNKFNKTRLATSLSLVLSATAFTSAPVFAEEAADTEVIKVKGIRGSLIRAMDVKRDSVGVVDAISAEDMGKFPDTNLAESLQRITGVSIDRDHGEGSKVTVRGFGPDYNLVLLNGRQMPTATIKATTNSDSRSFDFGTLASEAVSGVEVYKTNKASIATGGIGSTINLNTTRPLSQPGLKISVGAKAVKDTSSIDDDKITPEISGIFSNTFADDKFGIAFAASYQNRNSGEARAHVENSWRPTSEGSGGWGQIPGAPETGVDPHINRPANGTTVIMPQNLLYGFKDVERTRTNGQLTFQFQPIDNLTATLDYTYAKNEVEINQNIASVWMNFGAVASEWRDPVGGVSSPLWVKEDNVGVASDNGNPTYSAGELSFADLVSQVEQSAQVTENKSVGLNIEYKVTDNFKIKLDAHSSSAEAKPDSIYGNSNTIQMAANVRATTTLNFESEFPVAIVEYPASVTDPSQYANDTYPNPTNGLSNVSSLPAGLVRTTGTSFRNSYMKSEIDQIQLDGTYTFDSGIVESIDFGLGSNTVNNRTAFAMAERATWGGVGQFDDVPNELLEASRDTMADKFSGLPGDKSNMLNEFWNIKDFDAIAEVVGTKYGDPSDPETWPCGNKVCAPTKYTTDARTEEESTSAYVQTKLGFDIGSMPFGILAGVRYEKTDVTSNTLLPDVERVAWISDNEFRIERGEPEFFTGTGSYDYFLPAIDLNLEVFDGFVVRASASKTLTRPNYNNLTAGQRLNSVNRQLASGVRGNPGLKPIESTNYDLSVEWYYDEASYVSVGYFKKDVVNFIGRVSVTEQPYDALSPVTGSRFDDAFNKAKAANNGDDPSNADIRAQLLADNPADGVYIIEADPTSGQAAQIYGEPGFNDKISVRFDVPENLNDNGADGIEVAAQHVFGDSGFGAIVNFTLVDSDLEYDKAQIDRSGQAFLYGLSDSANLVGFYDKDGFQARIAYNWRDDFLADEIDEGPIFTEAYGQVDVNVSFELTENLTIFAEAINLTDEYARQYMRDSRATFKIAQTGARYNFGARYTF